VRANLSREHGVSPAGTQREDSLWSVGLFTLAGIPVRLHFTMVLLLAWLGFTTLVGEEVTLGALFIVGVLLSIGVHELAHTLAAAALNVGVRDVVLYPMGGISSVSRQLSRREDVLIAVAGPAASLAVAAALFLVTEFGRDLVPIEQLVMHEGHWIEKLMIANLLLATVNLLPAFPMDGGRILRAALARQMGDERAAAVVTAVGQGVAVVVGLYALLYQPLLLFVTVVVFLGAAAEANVYQTRLMSAGVPVEDAMMTVYTTLSPGDTLQKACELLLRGSQQDFPVVQHGHLVGLLTRQELLRGMGYIGPQGYVAGSMVRGAATTAPSADLFEVLSLMNKQGLATVPVLDGERMVGLITSENIAEYFAVKRQRQRSAR
jgi:Zn-dependent protease